MDGQRFDAWTRALASALPRRGALKTLAGITLAGVATRAAVSRIAADDGNQVGDYCDDKNPCNKDKGLVCVNRECEKKKETKCEGKGCKKKGKGKKNKKKNHGGGGSTGSGPTGCQSSADCGYYEKCTGDGQCVPIECIGDNDCPGDLTCRDTFECS